MVCLWLFRSLICTSHLLKIFALDTHTKICNHSLTHSLTLFQTRAPKSKLEAELESGDSFEFTAQGIVVVVVVSAIDTTASTPFATVAIQSGTEAPSQSFVPTVTLNPSQTPSTFPSVMPSPVNGISPSPTTEYDMITTNFLVGEFYAASKSGIMFDVTATEDVMITRLDIDLFYVNYDQYSFPTDVEIYIKSGSYKGYESRIDSWTKHMDRTTVYPPSSDDVSTLGLTPLKSDKLSPISIPGGSTVSIFITNRDANNFIEMAYSTTAVDYVSDDGVLTVETGLFQKYAEFAGEENDGWW